MPACNTGLAKVAVQRSADTFVVKIATFAKPQTVSGKHRGHTKRDKKKKPLIKLFSL